VDITNLTYPDVYSPPSEGKINIWHTWIWGNQEICNECFTQVRSIGPEVTVQGPIHTHYPKAWHDRTDNAVQEHTAFELASDRFGTTFCTECGSDTHSYRDRPLSKEELKERAVNIIEYINGKSHIPYALDGKIMGRAIRTFKAKKTNQGLDTEILAVSFAYAVSPT